MISSVCEPPAASLSPKPAPCERMRPHNLGGVLLLSLFVLCTAQPLRAARVLIILDASGSMRASAGSMNKMEAAKQAVRTTVEAIDQGSQVGLRLYGHRLPSEPKAPSCADTELVIPFATLDRPRFVAAVEAARPLGQTPLAHSLEQAVADFGELGDESAVIILVSDGEESCGGDPAKVACALAARGLELTIHSVGFDVDAVARQQLQAVARCTGGEYRDAKDANQLADSLQKLTQAGLLVAKQSAYGREVRGGDTYDQAVTVEPGVEFRLDHHQRKNEYDFFKIAVRGGQKLVATIQTVEKGVRIEGATFRENDNPYAGIEVHGPQRQKIGSPAIIIGKQNAIEKIEVPTSHESEGTYYVLVGNRYDHQNKDSRFKVELVDQYDAGSGRDAPASDDGAVEIRPGALSGWLHANDQLDHYSFEADPAGTYGLRARPQKAKLLRLSVFDADGVQIAKGDAPNPGAAVRLDGVKLPRAGKAFVRVESLYSNRSLESTYDLELTAEGVPAGSAEEAESSGDSEAVATESAFNWRTGCLAAVVLALLAFFAVVIVVVILFRRRRRVAK